MVFVLNVEISKYLLTITCFLFTHMSRITKIATFEYIVTKLIGLDLKKENLTAMGPTRIKELNEKLSEYPMTRYMVLLYFICLKDAQIKKVTHLFNIFDSFVAYHNGPVETSIYDNRRYEGTFDLFTFESNGVLKLREKSLNLKAANVLYLVSKNTRTAIDEALESLKQVGSKVVPSKSILEHSTTALVELSYKLDKKVWHDCFYYDKQKGKISELFQNADILADEIDAFEKSLIKI